MRSRKKSVKQKPVTTKSVKCLTLNMDNSKELNYNGNPGERTYVRQMNERKKSYHDLLKKYKHRNNSVTGSFKPTINYNSKLLLDEKTYNSMEREIAKLHSPNYGSFTCRNKDDSSFTRHKLLDRSKEEYIKMKQIQSKDCTFKPQLNKVTQHIVESKRKSVSSKGSNSASKTREEVFTNLYNYSKSHNKRLENFAQKLLKKQCPFKPTLNSSRSTKSKDFESKRKEYLKKLEKHRREHCKTIHAIEKPTNNTFVPQITKSRSGTRSRSKSGGKSVHEDLYQDSKIRQQKHLDQKSKLVYYERKRQFSKYLSKKGQKAYSGIQKRSKSRKIMDKIKAERCKDLFTKLDDDGDGYISSQKIDIL